MPTGVGALDGHTPNSSVTLPAQLSTDGMQPLLHHLHERSGWYERCVQRKHSAHSLHGSSAMLGVGRGVSVCAAGVGELVTTIVGGVGNGVGGGGVGNGVGNGVGDGVWHWLTLRATTLKSAAQLNASSEQ